jgi:hypothetical protein
VIIEPVRPGTEDGAMKGGDGSGGLGGLTFSIAISFAGAL